MNGEWDDLQEEIEADSQGGRQTHFVCIVGALIDYVEHQNGEGAADSLRGTLRNHRLSAASIRRALERRVPAAMLPSVWSIGHHRRRDCSCKEEES